MVINERLVRQATLFSLVAVIAPMLAFPARFGLGLARPSVANVGFELVFYGIAAFAIYRRGSLVDLIKVAVVGILFRFGLGVLFGLMITLMYSLDLKVAITLGTVSYLPAILPQIAVTPFILKPFFERPVSEIQQRLSVPQAIRTEPSVSKLTLGALSQSGEYMETPAPAAPEMSSSPRWSKSKSASPTGIETVNGFDRAVRYIGELASVRVTAVVDNEGLLLANFVRGDNDAESRAPFCLVVLEQAGRSLRNVASSSPERVDVVMGNERISAISHGSYNLMVVAEPHGDDLLNIRINQALEMINKYVSERYDKKLKTNAEKTYA